jgi:hypothetical protein
MSSPTGRNYAKIVEALAQHAGTNAYAPQGAGECEVEMREAQQAYGNAAVWPRVPEAKDLLTYLQSPGYSRYWEQVGMVKGRAVNVADAPQGAIAVWDDRIGDKYGHVAIVYHVNGHTYLLGNTLGNYSYDVGRSRQSGALWHPNAYFLPR